MNEEAKHLEDVLEREREAARRVDIDALVGIQEEKRDAIRALKATDASQSVIDKLASRARSNITLMRHLVQCLQGLSGMEESNYNASGAVDTSESSGMLHGSL